MTNPTTSVKTGQSFAALKNVAGFMKLVNAIIDRPPNTDGIGIMYGPSGFGKTEAAKYARNRSRGIKIDVYESWNRRTFVQAILGEAGFPNQRGSIAELTRHAIMILGDDPRRPLIIDEADTAFTKGFMGLVREIHDVSKCAVLLVGEELLPKRIGTIPQLHGRLFDTFGAEPCDLGDSRKLADVILREVVIDDTLLDKIRESGDGRARLIVSTLNKVNEFARNTGQRQLDAGSYKGEFVTDKVAVRHQYTAHSAFRKGVAA